MVNLLGLVAGAPFAYPVEGPLGSPFLAFSPVGYTFGYT